MASKQRRISDKIRDKWAGRKFRCLETGETLVIPSTVKEGDFFPFGKCFIDVGDLSYCRWSGKFEEI